MSESWADPRPEGLNEILSLHYRTQRALETLGWTPRDLEKIAAQSKESPQRRSYRPEKAEGNDYCEIIWNGWHVYKWDRPLTYNAQALDYSNCFQDQQEEILSLKEENERLRKLIPKRYLK